MTGLFPTGFDTAQDAMVKRLKGSHVVRAAVFLGAGRDGHGPWRVETTICGYVLFRRVGLI